MGHPARVRCRGCAALLMPFTDADAFTSAFGSLRCGQMSFLRQKTATCPSLEGSPTVVFLHFRSTQLTDLLPGEQGSGPEQQHQPDGVQDRRADSLGLPVSGVKPYPQSPAAELSLPSRALAPRPLVPPSPSAPGLSLFTPGTPS